jgi:hypothetical protein
MAGNWIKVWFPAGIESRYARNFHVYLGKAGNEPGERRSWYNICKGRKEKFRRIVCKYFSVAENLLTQ